ncbi:WD repeat-containing protein 12 [Cichlidogyrus casuarinus]|uniref:WD repeat-containing protein 12 n=1 Tax=Cichlidogyrus casuarinus TaxID=1844966 RepID=A0ABD2PN37_9PLAT
MNKHILDFFKESLEVFFIEKQQAPTQEQEISQDDFISWVARKGDRFLTAGYDCTIQLWPVPSPTDHPLCKIVCHDRVKCLDWINEHSFASAGFDQTAKLWKLNLSKKSVDNWCSLRGHKGPIMSIKCHDSKLATGSQDCAVKIWSSDETAPNEEEHKKQSSEDTIPTRLPLMTFVGHRQMVCSVDWVDENNVLSASWDHSMRMWDLVQQKETKTIMTGIAVHAMKVSPVSGYVLTGGASHGTRVYDLRATDSVLYALPTSQHDSSISALAWAPHKSDQFVTSTVHGSVLLWDLRNSKTCLYQLKAHKQMVTCVDWAPAHNKEHFILTSSADSTVKIFNCPQ